MKVFDHLRTLLLHPAIAWDYINYQASCLQHSGEAIRTFPDGVQITGWSGFSEFHCLGNCLTAAEREFFGTFAFSSGEFIDIGANLGLISLTLAKRFPTQAVHAFEPNPSTHDALKQNMLLNHCQNILPQAFVVTDYNGTISFNADPVRRGTTSIANQGDFLQSLPCLTLDHYADQNHLSEISLLKVDVEGYEEQVFRGASTLLKQKRIHVIYYEVCPDNARRCGFKPESATIFLKQHGYSIYRLDENGRFQSTCDRSIDQVILENWIAFRPS
jgi:FkbM family methyltransferase